jgi:MYXO-CTERM domain-containing protein
MDGGEADAARPMPAKRVVGCGCNTEGGTGGDHLMLSLAALGLLAFFRRRVETSGR